MNNIFNMLSSMQCIGTGALVVFSVLNIILFFLVLTIKNSTFLNRKQVDIDLSYVYYQSMYLRDKLNALFNQAVDGNKDKRKLLSSFDESFSKYDYFLHELLVKQMQGDYPAKNIKGGE